MRNIELVCKCVIPTRLPVNLNMKDMTEKDTFHLQDYSGNRNSEANL